MLINLRVPTLAALAVVQVLATSCGGGGGGGPLSSNIGNSFETNDGTAGALGRLASNEPRSGSVSQSSNRDGSGVTEDRVGVDGIMASSLVSVAIDVSGEITITLNAANAVEHIDNEAGTAEFTRENGNEFSAAVISVSFDDLPENTDWAAVGIWIHTTNVNSVDAANWHLGVFAESSNPYGDNPATDLTDNFEYEGTSEGYMVTLDDNDEYDFIAFTADVLLEADFTADTISGWIANVYEHSNAEDAVDYVIELQDATITNTNFFKGDLKVRAVSDLTNQASGPEYGNGEWGGQFFGDDGKGVLGTYGGYFDDDTLIDDIAPSSGLEEVWFAGAFIAVDDDS